jgi:nucleoside-diphosphate-sugar epimerase
VEADGHQVMAPGGTSLIVRPGAVSAAVRGIDAVLHLATRIQPLDRIKQAEAWQDNDRLCAEASAILVDTALAADVKAHVQPTVTFVYPGDRPISEDTPVGEVPVILRSALATEQPVGPFAAGRRGVVLRPRLPDGPGTGKDHPNPSLGATLHSGDAGCALLPALAAPIGIYNICRDGERVSNRRFAKAVGWHALR